MSFSNTRHLPHNDLSLHGAQFSAVSLSTRFCSHTLPVRSGTVYCPHLTRCSVNWGFYILLNYLPIYFTDKIGTLIAKLSNFTDHVQRLQARRSRVLFAIFSSSCHHAVLWSHCRSRDQCGTAVSCQHSARVSNARHWHLGPRALVVGVH